MPRQLAGGEERSVDGRKRAAAYIAFMVLMISIAVCCIVLFARALYRPQLCYPKEIHLGKLEIPDKALIVSIVGLISIVPLIILARQLLRAHKDADKDPKDPSHSDPTEVLLHLSVHAVPYGILSLSMLFEYHRLLGGQAEGAAALASIMILFILSEMGLILFTEVREAKHVSMDLRAALVEVKTNLSGMPWLKAHAKIARTTAAAPGLVGEIDSLLEEWQRFLTGGNDVRHILLNVLLVNYLHEEVKDISGDLDSTRLPEGIKLPPHWVTREHISIFAININLYASYLEKAVAALTREVNDCLDPSRRPCIVAVTTALPTQFWNWPQEPNKSVEYRPVSDYREAQFTAVKGGLARIFRTVLVEKDGNTEPTLMSEATWSCQKDWLLIVGKTGKEEPLTRSVVCPFHTSCLAPGLEWTQLNGKSDASLNAYWMAEGDPKGMDTDVYDARSVWEFYCRKMHFFKAVEEFQRTGRTEVVRVSAEIFNADWGKGFAGCSDLMFLGTCSSKTNDIWEEEDAQWGIALMSSMGTRSETMFLAVIHHNNYIKEIWENVKRGRTLADPLPVSDSLLVEYEKPAPKGV